VFPSSASAPFCKIRAAFDLDSRPSLGNAPSISNASCMAVSSGRLRPPKDQRVDNGSSAVWLIARDYNYKHLKSRKMSYWRLSGAALTIWVSRNWTTD
jgi:hypothetical protein